MRQPTSFQFCVNQKERQAIDKVEGVHLKDYFVIAAEIIQITQCVLKWARSQGDGNRVLPIVSRSDFSECITVCQSSKPPLTKEEAKKTYISLGKGSMLVRICY